MPHFEFSEKDHSYFVGGAKVPSVSEVIAPLSDFSSVKPEIMRLACEFGNNAHKTIEFYLNDELDEISLDPRLTDVLEQFKAWDVRLSAYFFRGADWIVEKRCFHPSLKYGGTPDIVVPGYAIIDFKTRKTNPIKDILQLTAYEAFYGKPGSHRLIVLELYEDRYKEVDLSNHKLRKQAWPMFRYLLDRWHRENEFSLKIEGWENKGR
ncbi:MAG: hypothetical protein AAB922_04730 [Patescibacteria group bacterium]